MPRSYPDLRGVLSAHISSDRLKLASGCLHLAFVFRSLASRSMSVKGSVDPIHSPFPMFDELRILAQEVHIPKSNIKLLRVWSAEWLGYFIFKLQSINTP
jgi:hypothetical protein